MICPRCEVEMVSLGGRLTCPECGYNEPLRRVVVADEGVVAVDDYGDDDQEDEIDDSV